MREQLPVTIVIVSVVFLFVIYLTGALDLSLTAAIIAASFLFKFQPVWLFLAAEAVFSLYLVTLFLLLKIGFVSDLSVSAYLFFAAGLILYFLEGQKSQWEISIPYWKSLTVKRVILSKLGLILLFVFLIYPVSGPHFAAIFGYLAFLYTFKKSDGRYAFGLALFFLILCPFLLIAKKEKIAEESAIFTYYFLVLGTFQEIIGLIINPPEDEEMAADVQAAPQAKFSKLHSQKVKEAMILRSHQQKSRVRNRKILVISATVFISAAFAFSVFYFGPGFFGKRKIPSIKLTSFIKKPTAAPTAVPTVTPTPTITPEQQEENLQKQKETLTVQVLNGTDITGLAASTAAILKNDGFANIDTANASENYDNWQAKIKEKDDHLINHLRSLLQLTQLAVEEASEGAKYDLEIVAGRNR